MTSRLLILLLTLPLLLGWRAWNQWQHRIQPGDEAIAAEVIRMQIQRTQAFVAQVQRLHTAAQEAAERDEELQLQQALIDTRRAYKRIEFIVAHLFPDHAKQYFNGAPLPHPVPDSLLEQKPEIRPPHGLQLLDELIFADDLDYRHIERETSFLLHQAEAFHDHQEAHLPKRLSQRRVYEACRFEVIRIFTLGVTGFDTPASGQALPEALVSLRTLGNALETFEDPLEAANDTLAERIFATLGAAEGYLAQHQDFDTFDRLTWLTDYTQPLWADLLQAQLALKLPTMYDRDFKPDKWEYPVNYLSTEVFDADFFALDGFLGHYHRADEAARIELGQLLFFDPILSDNGERSCASCHDPKQGFTDGLARSVATGMQGQVSRNAPTLVNAAFSHGFFHDLRVHNLEDQIDHVVLNPQEFQTDYEAITAKVFQSEEYAQRFTEAFPEMHRTQRQSGYILKMALAAYVGSLTSFDSEFDRYVRGELAEIDPAVKRGFNLFMGKAACGTCHFAPSFGGIVPPSYRESESEVLGVPANADFGAPRLDPDLGRQRSGWPVDSAEWFGHHFKTPTVRNVALTAPYMHNGVYRTLDEVMRFYHMGGGLGLGLEVPNQTLPPDSLDLTPRDLDDMIAFMQALTDTAGLTAVPRQLPRFPDSTGWNDRVMGGTY